MESFYANGKLLISGEYAVLDGALSLAIPCKFGQRLEVEYLNSNDISWTSYKQDQSVWFKAKFSNQFEIISASDKDIAVRLISILKYTRKLNPNFLTKGGVKIKTLLDFPVEWGLGTSSTLVSLISDFANVNPFELYLNTFGGSGYDIACAKAKGPILYQLIEGLPKIKNINFQPEFTNHMYFVYLDKKQNSREGIKHFRENNFNSNQLIHQISELTNQLIPSQSLSAFTKTIDKHEVLISKSLNIPTIKSQLFQDFEGSIKSLGAWGGDFILAIPTTSTFELQDYFQNKGYTTIIPYAEMVL